MNPLDLLYAAGAAWAVAGVAGLLFGRSRSGLRVSCGLSALGGAAAAAGGGWSLVYGNTPVVSPGTATLTGGPLQLQATSLAGVFTALLGVVAVAIALYAPRYHAPSPGTGLYLAVYNVALLACLAVLAAGGMVTFLVAWETMSLACYLVILRHPRRGDVARGAFWFLALSEAGFLLVVAAFVILSAKTGGATSLAAIAARAASVPGGWRAAAFLLALAGFGFKAGLVPLHVWLPEAHPVAPADGSAFLSGVVVKLGAYGIALFAFRLAPPTGSWPGLAAMGAGAVTAAIGILYAMAERDIKRFLAFSTIENTGIIVTAFGAAMIFHAYRQQALWAFLLIAGLYHVANHGCYKTLLFLEAGVTEHATGTRDMDRLGGLVHRLPRSAVIAFVGTLGIAALPPLNGFVSEWLVFQGLFQGFRTGSHLIGILIVLAAGTLGLTGGLAIYAFVRGFGIPYLGMPRTRSAADASEDQQPVLGPGLLAVACVALSIGAPVVLVALSKTARVVTGVSLGPLLLPGNLTVLPAHADFAAFSPTYLTVFLVCALAVPVLIYLAGRPRARSASVPVWDGGIVSFKPRMQYSAMTFAAPTRVMFDALYRPTVTVRRPADDDPAGRSGPVHYEARVTPVFHRYLYQPAVRALEAAADFVRPIQSGDVNLYLLYVFAVILLAYLLGAV
jgi:hydrogenase-4 component B